MSSQVARKVRFGAVRSSCLFAIALLAVLLGCGVYSSVADAAPQLSFTSVSAGGFNANGTPSTQAGAHPWELVSSFVVGTVFDSRAGYEVPDGALKDTGFELPAGVIGDPGATSLCSQPDMGGDGSRPIGSCPIAAQVGYADLDVQFFGAHAFRKVPVFSLVPPPGEPAQFAFVVVGAIAHVDVKLRSDGDYGVTATVHNANAGVPVFAATVHLWGVPADSSHDEFRAAPGAGAGGDPISPGPSGLPRKPFLRNPTSCGGPEITTLRATSWAEPERVVTEMAESPAMIGCASLPFAPTLTLTPDTKQAGAPAGLAVDLDLPQNENPDGLATADLKKAVVTLPAGVTVNPSAANDLAGCTDAQFALHSADPDTCPESSNIGSTEVTTPLLPKPLTGSAYLAAPLEQSPAAAAAGRMFRVFLELHGSGIQVKLLGTVVPDSVTGQLVATFDSNPQAPFSNFHMSFTGGPSAPLSLPRACGTYTTHSELTSWASNTPVFSDGSFTIDQSCDQAGRFEPSVSAGVTNATAGAFSPFILTLSRPDGQQDVSALDITLPPGLIGNISSVPLCPEAQAATGTCSPASQIGRTTIASGAGTSPLWVPQAGKSPTAVYLAGPYKGAPFSLSVVVPAEAGPFNLGSVVVRAALFVDPHDAHVSVKSDPIPTILDGVPLNVQKINVTVDRPGFILAPTNCNPMQVTGNAHSSAGASAALVSRFQVGSCAGLKFQPKFSASSVGGAGGGTGAAFRPKPNGVSLKVKLAYPDGSIGSQADIAKVKVELPKQLPSRLTTLQKACTAAQFESNPAGCPPESVVGHATVSTPLLPVPLTGPAYFVSHGGEAFPSLTMVLQGYGVTVELVGTTFISKAGITSTTFNTVPDVPFSSFELNLPQGKFSALTGNGDLCKSKLVMPTDYVAQNGAVLHQSNVIAIAGCPKTKALTRAQKLAVALKACKRKSKGKRAACQAQARKRYGAVKARKAGKKR
jgi:hypothetical protein